jgi:hypothetical protein
VPTWKLAEGTGCPGEALAWVMVLQSSDLACERQDTRFQLRVGLHGQPTYQNAGEVEAQLCSIA